MVMFPLHNNNHCRLTCIVFFLLSLASRARESAPCVDLDEDCEIWTIKGDCNTDAAFMFAYCPVSCEACHLPRRRVEIVTPQQAFAQHVPHPARHRPISPQDYDRYDYSGERYYLDVIRDVVGADLGVPQTVTTEAQSGILRLLERAREYWTEWSNSHPTGSCLNQDASCALQAVHDACTNTTTQDWMYSNCQPLCFACGPQECSKDDDAACFLDGG